MQLDIDAYQALRREIIDNRASVLMLLRVIRAQENEILRLRALERRDKK